jgi:hypothetical protein
MSHNRSPGIERTSYGNVADKARKEYTSLTLLSASVCILAPSWGFLWLQCLTPYPRRDYAAH